MPRWLLGLKVKRTSLCRTNSSPPSVENSTVIGTSNGAGPRVNPNPPGDNVGTTSQMILY